MKKQIGVVGVGRLGICFALLLDRAGHKILASDIRTNYVAALNQRRISTTEPQVAEMLVDSQIEFVTDTRRVVKESEIIYVMVATPSLSDGNYDVTAVHRVVDDIRECDFDISGKILVIGCTTNPGDCSAIQDSLRDKGVQVLYNPEFIAQGSIIRDLENADMVLIGGEDQETMDEYKKIYDDIQPHRVPDVHTMSLSAAELVKIATNCFLTTKISYANMVGEVLIRSGLEADVDSALKAIGSDTRIGHKYLRYGFGFGGPCLPRDNRAFAHYAESIGLDFPLGSIVDQFNKDHTEFITDWLIENNQHNLPFYFASITYKPNTDIIEESQQLQVAINLLRAGHAVIIKPDDRVPTHVYSALQAQFPDSLVLGDDQGEVYRVPNL